jgi:hypothetical protein
MNDCYLEITYRRGRPLAAYLYLPRREGDKSRRVVHEGPGLMVDMAEDGRPIGIEIVSPRGVSLAAVNAILARYSMSPLGRDDLAPLAATA